MSRFQSLNHWRLCIQNQVCGHRRLTFFTDGIYRHQHDFIFSLDQWNFTNIVACHYVDRGSSDNITINEKLNTSPTWQIGDVELTFNCGFGGVGKFGRVRPDAFNAFRICTDGFILHIVLQSVKLRDSRCWWNP